MLFFVCYNVGNKKKGQPKLSQQEFLSILSETLNMELTPNEVSGNIAYYSSYFAEETSKGKSEEEVIAELGEPRMIAKSIIEAARAAQEPYGRMRFNNREYKNNSSWDGQQYEQANGGTSFEYQKNGKNYHVSGKIAGIAFLVLFLLILMLLLMLISGLLRLLLPIFLPVLLLLLGIYLLRQR